MTLENLFDWIAIGTGYISAVCWLKSAKAKTPLPMAYVSGPPAEIVKQITYQSIWNKRAALFACSTAFLQASSYLVRTFFG